MKDNQRSIQQLQQPTPTPQSSHPFPSSPKLRILRTRAQQRQSIQAHTNTHLRILRKRQKSKRNTKKSKIIEKKQEEGYGGQQKIPSARKGTLANRCKNRRNPYFIYSDKKKTEFFQELNTWYKLQIKDENQKNSESEPKGNPLISQLQSQMVEDQAESIERQTERIKSRRSRRKTVKFHEKIQIREYWQQESIDKFLDGAPVEQDINQEQNKLDV